MRSRPSAAPVLSLSTLLWLLFTLLLLSSIPLVKAHANDVLIPPTPRKMTNAEALRAGLPLNKPVWKRHTGVAHGHKIVGRQVSATPTPTPTEVGRNIFHNWNTAKCVEVRGDVRENGTPVQIYDCNGTPAQKWMFGRGATKIRLANSNFCVDAGNPANNALVKIWKCYDGLAAQEWTYTGDNRFMLTGTNFCLDLPQGNEANTNQLQLYSCTNWSTNRVWTT